MNLTLKELFEAASMEQQQASGDKHTSQPVALILHEGYKYHTEFDDGYKTILEPACDLTHMPESFLPYADNQVLNVREGKRYFDNGAPMECTEIRILSVPDENMCEIFNSGGGIYCAIIKLEGGWFMGEVNSWGCVWKTLTGALETYPTEESGFIRTIEEPDELIQIWRKIYENYSKKSEGAKWRCDNLLATLEEDVRKSIETL